MNYCPNCGAPLGVGQNFCRNCGLDVREPPQTGQVQILQEVPDVRGLGRNEVVYLTQGGLFGVEFRSGITLFLAFLMPLLMLSVAYYLIQTGSLAVYATIWMATSLLLYDELRWRGLRNLGKYPPSNTGEKRKSWMAPWQSIRMVDWNGRTLWFATIDPTRKVTVTFDENVAPLVERTLNSWRVRYAWRPSRLPKAFSRFWTLALLLFVISQAILILAATLPFFPGEVQMYNTILNNTKSGVTGATFAEAFRAIFLNNIQVAWGGMIPFLGQLSFGIASYNTGRVIQAIAISDNLPSSVILVSLYLFPHTWIEESAYPIATVAGFLAITKWRSVAPDEFTRRLNRGSTKLALAMGGVVLILFVAGLIETTGLFIGLGEILFWIPLGVGYFLLVTRLRRRKQSRRHD